ncbi:hypothetical protein SAY87_014344 [Trapa incisa]|uniref:Uncharacterized protein n=2 Tax=Trapa TaxID=22665 RepID=A0AAN7RGE7_TRANT|nr:hypothetical protein SAY87_014344 [Trapa incisa]KAK4803147.1 hypothetical protein SAY86_001350 [Trapa natans]
MGHCYCYKCKHPPNPGPMPYPVLVLLLITIIFILLSNLLEVDSLFEPPELDINWGLLALPIIILAAVHLLSSRDRSPKCYGPPVPCCRCWNSQCYCR